MADISKIITPDGTEYSLKDAGALRSYTETDPVFTASAAHGISSNDISNWNGKTSNVGTVTSVRVQASSPVQSSTSTAQTSTLNTTISLASGYGDTQNPYGSKTKNYILAAPISAAGNPTFRALDASDIPTITKSKISDFPTIPDSLTDLTNDLSSINYTSHWPATATTYYLSFNSSTADANGLYSQHLNNGLRYRTRAGTTSTDGLAMLYLGNNTASGTAGNSYGAIMLYGTSSNYIQLRPATSLSTSPTIYFPDKGGTVALLDDVSGGGGGGGKSNLWSGAITSGSATLSDNVSGYDFFIVTATNGQTGTSYVTTVCPGAGTYNIGWEASSAYIEFTLSGTSLTINTASNGRYLRQVIGVQLSANTNADNTSY